MLLGEEIIKTLAIVMVLGIPLLLIGWWLDHRDRRKVQRIYDYMNNVNRRE